MFRERKGDRCNKEEGEEIKVRYDERKKFLCKPQVVKVYTV
jgi:hypothetical protein